MVGGKTAPAGGSDGASPVLTASGSHLYRGAQGGLSGRAVAGPCMVEFADGSLAFGRLAETPSGLVLELDGYTTARGTDIPTRRWALEVRRAGGAARFRVRARMG